jgi:glycosyltransferase involved in cell wall biosynthesis
MAALLVNARPRAGNVICMALHDLRGGGAERASLRLASGMIAAGRAVELVLVRCDGAYLDDVPKGASIVPLDCAHVWQAVPVLARYLSKRRPRALLSALTHMNIAAVMAAKLSGARTRLVVSERNQFSAKAQAASLWRERATYAVAPALYRRADRIVAVSHGCAADLVLNCRIPAERVRVIHNPVFDADIQMKAAEPADHPWFAEGAPPVILAVGRLNPQKDYPTLLRAFAEIHAQRPVRLLILGEGSERAALEALAQQLGVRASVSMPGFASNPFAYMSRAAVLALSSRFEGFPNVLVEAMACGTPIVATDCPSGPREILDGVRYGALVAVGDSHAFAEALLRTLSQPKRGDHMRARAAHFSIAKATADYLQELEA